MGQIIGPLISYNFYIYYMDKIPNLGKYFFIGMGCYMFITTILSYLYIEENRTETEFKSALDIIKIFPAFFKNPNIRNFIQFGFFSRLPMAFWGTVNQLILVKLGVDKDIISKFSTLQIIFSVIFMFVISKLDFTDNIKLF